MKTILKFLGYVVVLMALVHATQAADQKFKITTLSSRPDMISGGDALVQINLPANVVPEKVAVKLNGQDVTSALHADAAAHTLTGLVDGLKVGDNTLEVFNGAGKKPVVQASLRNYPITGPILSAPQEEPFVCQTQDFKLPDGSSLGAPLDANCSVKTVVTYVYKSTEAPAPPAEGARGGRGGRGGGAAGLNLKPLRSMTELPVDVAYTTTTTGEKVPYIVRIETGTINRGIYQFVVLTDPTKETQLGPLNPPKEWNKRLVYSFGPGCGAGWRQGTNLGIGPIISDAVVGKGYAEASSTLDVFGNNCNDVISAETMMMVKERFIKAYGRPDFTFSRGGSGGSEQQVPIADNYPGLLDGIIPAITFPDLLSNAYSVLDTQLLNKYFANQGASLTLEQKQSIAGAKEIHDFSTDNRVKAAEFCPAPLEKSQRYDAAANRTGVRCDVFDHAVAIYGRDPATGFARRPLDNVGVQYGLAALNAGTITPAQFLDLNKNIGGWDNDGELSANRTAADPEALRVVYTTGRMTYGGQGLSKIPIIDVRTYRDQIPGGDVHQKFHSFSLRARLMKTNGTIANDVMLVAPTTGDLGSDGGTSATNLFALQEMDKWLTNVQKDTSNDPAIKKIERAKPADLADSCYSSTGERIVEPQTFTGGKCNDLYPTYMSPRMVAGSPAANDILKCQLKPADTKDYKAKFSDAERAELASVFPSGVCDWSKPGVGQRAPTATWQAFSGAAADQGKGTNSSKPLTAAKSSLR